MKILTCHNYYQQPGGEDQVFDDEARLLESHGHTVVRFTRHNDAIKQMSSWQAAVRTLWNRQTVDDLRNLIRRERPDVVHFTNTFPLISPSAYYAARREGVKIVQSLHNYRLLCPNAYLLRDGKVCESCVGKLFAWPAVRYACYRDDRRASGVVAAMLAFHRAIGTYSRVVDLFCALTEFGKRKFIEGGLPAEKIAVKPNFMSVDPGIGDGSGGDALFVGRLSPEKGIETLLAAWSQSSIDIPLSIVGDGPLAERVRQAAEQNPRIRWLGRQPPERVLDQLGTARFLIFPSVWYEGLPKTIVEAFSKGTPVVASNLGAMTELIDDGRTGLLFEPGNVDSLRRAVSRVASDSDAVQRMRIAARGEFERKFTAEQNYKILIGLYHRVLGRPFPASESEPSLEIRIEETEPLAV